MEPTPDTPRPFSAAPPPLAAPPLAPTLLVTVTADTAYLADLATQMLSGAESKRRDANGSFDPAARGAPTADWGLAGTIIARAVHHLDEAVPNGQAERVSLAMGALLIGTSMLERALVERGVPAARLHHAAPPEKF